MNTLVISLVSLTVIQLPPPPSQFDPGQLNSPAPVGFQADERSAGESLVDPPDVSALNPADRGATFRLTDEASALPAPPTFDEPAAPTQLRPSQLRPNREWATQESRPAATRGSADTDVIPVHSADSEALAAMILDGAMEMRDMEGTDVALVDLLRRISDSGTRQRAVQSYWRLCLAIAEQNFAAHEAHYLSKLPPAQSPLDDSLLAAELTQTRARQATAALKVLELQEELSTVGRLDLHELPRPVDRPFVGPYATHFEHLFANRTPPTRLKQIDRRLPHELEVIQRRADAVAAGERAAAELAQAYERGAAGLSQVLDALTMLSRTRRELLAAVLSYNEQIAEYSLAVVSPSVAPQSLLGTLIRREAAAQPTLLADANVRPASAETPVLEPGEVDGAGPLRPLAESRGSLPATAGSAEASRSILKRVTIDHR